MDVVITWTNTRGQARLASESRGDHGRARVAGDVASDTPNIGPDSGWPIGHPVRGPRERPQAIVRALVKHVKSVGVRVRRRNGRAHQLRSIFSAGAGDAIGLGPVSVRRPRLRPQ